MAASTNTANQPKNRISFAKLREPLQAPNLLGLQTESFDWLLGNDAWKARVDAAKAAGRVDVPDVSGLEEIFQEISPIEDVARTMSLSFRDHRLERPKYSVEEAKLRLDKPAPTSLDSLGHFRKEYRRCLNPRSLRLLQFRLPGRFSSRGSLQ